MGVGCAEDAESAGGTGYEDDLADAAVERRIRMLRLGGAKVSVAGFRRGAISTTALAGPVRDLGQTEDARLLSRSISVATTLARIASLKETVSGADVVMARNLEMLAVASRARAMYAPNATLIYECLDIHRLLLSKGAAGKFLRAIEDLLWRDVHGRNQRISAHTDAPAQVD